MLSFSKILGIFKRDNAPGGAQTPQPVGSVSPFRYGVDGFDIPVSSAMAVATVYRCVALLCGSVASLQLQYKRLRDTRFVDDHNNALHYLLTVQPNEAMSAYDFKERMVQDILLTGNCYIYPEYDYITMGYSRLVICSRGSVSHNTLANTYTIKDPYNGVSGKFDASEVIHIKGLPGRDSRTGVSVLANAARAYRIAAAGDRETQKRFEKGGNMRAFVTDDRGTKFLDAYDPTEVKKVAVDLNERVINDEQFTSVPPGVEVRPYTLSSSDMQFLESRKFTVREICRFFGVHPSFVFDDTSNNYKSAEMSKSAFLSDTLNPLLLKIENEFLRKLTTPSLCCKRKFQFDRRGLFASDLETKMRYYQQAIAAGVYTVNDIKAFEDMPAVEDGDRTLISANLRALSDVTTDVPPQPMIIKNNDEKD